MSTLPINDRADITNNASHHPLLRVHAIAMDMHATPTLPHRVHSERYPRVGTGQQAQTDPIGHTRQAARGDLVVSLVPNSHTIVGKTKAKKGSVVTALKTCNIKKTDGLPCCEVRCQLTLCKKRRQH